MNTRFARMASMVVLGTLAGCASSAGRPASRIASDSIGAIVGDPSVEAVLESLDPRTLQEGKERVLSFGLRNRSEAGLEFAWALEWYDRAGKLIPTGSAWTPMALGSGASRAVRVVMPPQAQSWRLRAVRA